MSTPVRASVTTTGRIVRRRVTSSNAIHTPGPSRMNSIDDAFTLPAVMITSAMSAGSLHPPSPRCASRTARMVRPMSQGSATHARRITEMRAVNASWYGVSMYTSAPVSAPSRFAPNRAKSQPRAQRREQ